MINKKYWDIFRWILILPTWLVIYFAVPILFYIIFGVRENYFMFAILPYTLTAIVEFFAMHALAPYNKKNIAIFAGVLTFLWAAFVMYGLSHLAY